MHKNILNELEALRIQIMCDFSAVALMNSHDHKIQWKFVSGNINNRYKRMVEKPGVGLAGHVFRHGRLLVVNSHTSNGTNTTKYPIMLAEKLQVVVAVPIIVHANVIAVLVVGYRSPININEAQIKQIEQSALAISTIYEQQIMA